MTDAASSRSRPPDPPDGHATILHIVYDEVGCPTPTGCVLTIRLRLDKGWSLSRLRGPDAGPFLLTFRRDELL